MSQFGCGTNAGYTRHSRKREKACTPCRIAHRDYQRQLYNITLSARCQRDEAQQQAWEALAHRHPEEYADLYAAALLEERAS